MLPTHAVILTGTVSAVEALPEGRRIALEAVQLDGGETLQRWLRVRLKKGDAQEVGTGDSVRLRALVRPPMPVGLEDDHSQPNLQIERDKYRDCGAGHSS